MPDTFVALDLEMTGADLDSDAIIEVGALRFTRDGVIDRYATLVKPGRNLPRRIETLTGIRAADLKNAPDFDDIRAKLASFIGSHPVVGQRIAWDLQFLERVDLRPSGPVFDTADLAATLLPTLSDYSLHTLTRQFGIDFPVQHRALPDAEATMAVFCKLLDRIETLDPALLDEIVHQTGRASWTARYLFRDAAARVTGRRDGEALVGTPVRQERESLPALQPSATRRPVQSDEIVAVLDAAAAQIDGFEHRAEQGQMAARVGEALVNGEELVVEAGTGTGKSLAYLLPSAMFALRNNERVIVSTNTINLQQQITGKDIPTMRRLLELGGPPDIRAALPDLRTTQLKGRRNYLCLQRLAALRRTGPENDLEARFLTRVLIWLAETETGDRAELTLSPDEEPLWSRISAQNSTCFAGPSPFVRSGACQLLRARRRAEASHLVVVNHALLLSDVAAGGSALPDYDYLVIDEAHNLEDEATNQFGFQAGAGQVEEYLNALHHAAGGREAGLVGDVHTAVRGTDAIHNQVRTRADGVRVAVDKARLRIPELFSLVAAFVKTQGEASGDYDHRLLLTPALRASQEWQVVALAWENLRAVWTEVEDALLKLYHALEDAGGNDILDWDALKASVVGQTQAGMVMRHGMEQIIDQEDHDRISWVTTNRAHGGVSLSSAPLDVGSVLSENLFGGRTSTVLTSATLSTSGTFEYVKKRLGVPEAQELLLGSPFDYKRAALVLIPADIPEPSYALFQRASEEAIIKLCTASKGRALVLFTSHAALRATARAVRGPLEREGITLFAQGIDGTPAELLDALTRRPGSVLFGTSSFWEGVDVVGEALSLLIITKLPFSVPTDPVFTARSAEFAQPFRDYALPQAVLRFKQGFGRLIRHKADRGVVVVLDRRLRSKSYGRTFTESLPACSISQAPLAQLPDLVARWLAAKRAP